MAIVMGKRLKGFAVCIAVAVLAAAVGGGVYVYKTRHIRLFGLELAPTRDFPVREVTGYLQNDPQWADDLIGDSRESMAASGCLISCVAASMEELGVQITPQELNRRLTAVGGFDKAVLIWYKIKEAVPEIDYRYSRVFTNDTIEQDLENGELPIVKVRYRGGLAQHWVLIVGARDGEYLVHDPLREEGEPIPLSVHGKVYAYRVLVPVA